MLEAAPKILDAMVIEKITASGAVDRNSLVDRGQFWGFSGSLGPSHVTNSKAGEGGVVLEMVLLGIGGRLTARLSAIWFSGIYTFGSMMTFECKGTTLYPLGRMSSSFKDQILRLKSIGSAIGQDPLLV
jgi:hypothetical protein